MTSCAHALSAMRRRARAAALCGLALGALGGCRSKRAAPAPSPAPPRASASARAAPGNSGSVRAAPSPASRRAAVERRLGPLVARLARLREVDGSAVGVGGTPGAFFMLTFGFAKQAHPGDFEALATDSRPIVRAMGLYGIAQEPPARAVRGLLPHVGDPGFVLYDTGGCMVSETPLGLFAHDLLADSHVLGALGFYPAGSPPPARMLPRPLLTKRQLFAVDLGILADDRIAGMSYPVPQDLADAVAKGKLAFDLDQLLAVARFRHLAAWQVVKAVGRIEPLKGPRPPAQLALLVRALRDERLDPEARFAAASALTRFSDDAAARAISSERYFLDYSAGTPLAARFIETIRRRREHERLMAPIDHARWDFQMAPLWHRALRAYSETHPLALDDLTSTPDFGDKRDAELRALCTKSLLAMVRHFDRYSEPWDTYADAPYELDWTLQSEFAAQDFTAEQLGALRSAVKAYFAAHPATQ